MRTTCPLKNWKSEGTDSLASPSHHTNKRIMYGFLIKTEMRVCGFAGVMSWTISWLVGETCWSHLVIPVLLQPPKK